MGSCMIESVKLMECLGHINDPHQRPTHGADSILNNLKWLQDLTETLVLTD